MFCLRIAEPLFNNSYLGTDMLTLRFGILEQEQRDSLTGLV